MAKLMKLSSFARSYFAEGEAPTMATLRKLVDSGELAGTRIGSVYYVDIHKFESTGNSLVDRVLLAS